MVIISIWLSKNFTGCFAPKTINTSDFNIKWASLITQFFIRDHSRTMEWESVDSCRCFELSVNASNGSKLKYMKQQSVGKLVFMVTGLSLVRSFRCPLAMQLFCSVNFTHPITLSRVWQMPITVCLVKFADKLTAKAYDLWNIWNLFQDAQFINVASLNTKLIACWSIKHFVIYVDFYVSKHFMDLRSLYSMFSFLIRHCTNFQSWLRYYYRCKFF